MTAETDEVGTGVEATAEPAVGPDGPLVADEREAQTVERSPADVLRLVVAGIVLLVAALLSRLFGASTSDFVADLLGGLQRLPAALVTVVAALGELLGLGLVVVGGRARRGAPPVAPARRHRRRGRPVGAPLLAGAPQLGRHRRGRHPRAGVAGRHHLRGPVVVRARRRGRHHRRRHPVDLPHVAAGVVDRRAVRRRSPT